MRSGQRHGVVDSVRSAAIPLAVDDDFEDLLELIGDARYVLLGEASHGTHEFYRERARITQRLIAEKGFNAVAIEGDWPDAYRANRFVRGLSADASASDALAGFRRFPTWMWRNTEVAEFLTWQRRFNDRLPEGARSGFYGMDLYSLHASMEAVLEYLDKRHPEAAKLARERYACFDRFGDDSQMYGLMTGVRGAEGCEDEVIAALVDMRRRAASVAFGGRRGDDDAFDAEQNARLVKNAEAYYRSMYLGAVSSWNLRDRHMFETLVELESHLGQRGATPRIVVWAHNSHLGDARATEMGRHRSELNVGQLVREQYGDKAVLVGFSTHTGTVTAASDWDGPGERKRVVPSRDDSFEGVMHDSGIERFLLPLQAGPHVAALRDERLERAIGVIYRPDTERQSHYFYTRLADQFDALIHIDVTRALEPLEPEPAWRNAEVPETYPTGM